MMRPRGRAIDVVVVTMVLALSACGGSPAANPVASGQVKGAGSGQSLSDVLLPGAVDVTSCSIDANAQQLYFGPGPISCSDLNLYNRYVVLAPEEAGAGGVGTALPGANLESSHIAVDPNDLSIDLTGANLKRSLVQYWSARMPVVVNGADLSNADWSAAYGPSLQFDDSTVFCNTKLPAKPARLAELANRNC